MVLLRRVRVLRMMVVLMMMRLLLLLLLVHVGLHCCGGC